MQRTIEILLARYADAFNRQDAGAFAALFAEDAQLMPPHAQVITGRDAIRQALPHFWDLGLRDLQLTPLTVRRHEDIVLDSGRWSLRIGAGAGVVEDKGKDLRVWQRQADGSWQIIFDIWNTDLPPAPRTATP